MSKLDYLFIIIGTWAVLTSPIYILAVLYLGSWENLIAVFEFKRLISMSIEDIGSAIFFVGPWLIIAFFLIKRLVSRAD